jgi:hypothetical protein
MYDYLLVFGDSKWTAPPLETQVITASVQQAPPPTAKQPTTSTKKAALPVPTKKKATSKPD